MADFFGKLQIAKDRKHESYNSLISMNQTAIYHRSVLCKKPIERRPIRGAIAIFPIVSKMAFFRKITKEGPRKNLIKWPSFWETSEG